MVQTKNIGVIEQVVNFSSVDFKKDSCSGCNRIKPEQDKVLSLLSLILINSHLFKRSFSFLEVFF